MAIKIPIVTVFDSKGLKQAQYQLNKIRGNFQNLGRNFAIAGAAFTGVGVLIGKSVQNAAEAQKVFAQTEAVLKSTGTTANGTAQDIANMSEKLMKLSAFEDEAIQSGANLLLTFKNIKNGVGEGNDIFDQTMVAMLDVARAMGTDASSEAIRLGKALNDPIKGMSALTRVGIQFTEGQRDQIEALVKSGDLMGAQKIILQELQSQFGGSAAAYAQTFAGQLELLQGELGNLSEEIGMIVMPALQQLVTAFRDIAPEAGAKLRDALNAVDWSAVATGISNTVVFFIENADAILKVVAAIWVLNTAYNTLKVIQGLYAAATVITNAVFGATTTAVGLATVAVNLFRIALLATGIGAFVVVVGYLIDRLINYTDATTSAYEVTGSWGGAIRKSGQDAQWAASRYGVAATNANGIGTAIKNATGSVQNYRIASAAINANTYGPQITSIEAIERAWKKATAAKINYGQSGAMWGGANSGFNTGFTMTTPLPKGKVFVPGVGLVDDFSGGGNSGGGAGKALKNGLAAVKKNLQKQLTQVRLTKKLINKGLPAGLAGEILGGTAPFKTARKILAGTDAAAAKLAKKYNKVQKAQDSLKESSEDVAQAMTGGGGGGSGQISAEEQAYKKRVENLKSFQESVRTVFGQIQESILKAFDLPELGDSTNAIIRNMNKLLDKTKAFASNISQLSSMGLNPELLQQIISQGPMAGARIAAALVSGGATALAEINAGYAEMLAVSGQIANTGTTALATTPQQTNIYNIEVGGGMLTSGAEMGRAIVDAIKAYERTSGAVWSPA